LKMFFRLNLLQISIPKGSIRRTTEQRID